jgi:hypothetical protein
LRVLRFIFRGRTFEAPLGQEIGRGEKSENRPVDREWLSSKIISRPPR